MQQRTKNQTTVKVCPYVPKRVRDTAERLAKRKMSKTKEPVFSTPFIANWATVGHDIANAETDHEALAHVERLRGKPIGDISAEDAAGVRLLLVVAKGRLANGTTTLLTAADIERMERVFGKALALPVADGAT